MIREQTLRARQKLVSKLPVTGELLRGSLLERTVRHTKDCPKCSRGDGHQVFVLTVTYPGHRTRQFSVRRGRVAEGRRWWWPIIKAANIKSERILEDHPRHLRELNAHPH